MSIGQAGRAGDGRTLATGRGIDAYALALIAVLAAAGLAYVFLLMGRGVDFSDEGLYLNVIRDPFLYARTVSQYSFVYHPLYLLVDGDIALLRRISLAFTTGLAGVLCFMALTMSRGARVPKWTAAGIAVIVAVCALLPLKMWLPTPNYNSLCLQGLLIASIGLIYVDADRAGMRLPGWLAIGVGGFLVAAAKPSSAIILAAIMVVYLLTSLRRNLIGSFIAFVVAAALGLALAFAIDGSLTAFYLRLTGGTEVAAMLGGGHTIDGMIRWDPLSLNREELILLSVAMAGSFLLVLAGMWPGRAVGALANALTLLLMLCAVAILTGLLSSPITDSTYLALAAAAAGAGALLGSVVALLARWERPARFSLFVAIAFALLPFGYALGTNNNLWATASFCGVFWIVAAVIAATGIPAQAARTHTLTTLTAVAAAVSLIAISDQADRPYRQTQSLHDQQTAFVYGDGSQLRLSADFAAYLTELRDLATAAGFQPGEPFVDLTGHYPTAVFMLDGQAIGQGWMIGGYSGSNDLATFSLGVVPCSTLSRAWALAEPDGPRALSAGVFGFAMQHEEVGSLNSPRGTYPDSYRQVLLRPAGDPAAREAACEAARKNAS